MSEQNQTIQTPSNPAPSGEQNNPQPKGNFLGIMSQHKKLFLLFAAGLVALVISIILLSQSFSQKTVPDDRSTSPSPTESVLPTDIQPTETGLKEAPTPTPNNSKVAEEIKIQIKPQLDQLIQVDYEISRVKVYEEIWALIQVTNPTTDPANLLLKKENGTWKVLLGPGTHFDDEELNKLGAPAEIKNDINFVGF